MPPRTPFGLLIALLPALLLSLPAVRAEGISISDTVVKLPLQEGVGMDDAVESMKLRANALNFKLVAELPLYKEIQAMGLPSKRVEIFQFCDARIAHAILAQSLDFAAYLPCRITLIEDQDGQAWLVTLNLERVITMANMAPEFKPQAMKVWDIIQEIMDAGVSGDL